MQDILTEIIARKRIEVEQAKRLADIGQLKQQCTLAPPPPSMRQALEQSPTGIIAEFKRRSPSKGWINREARVDQVLPAYAQAGTAASSVLTDTHFFGGSTDDLARARTLTALPLLCKDFIIDSLQLLQARAAGASAVLLIAAALSPEECASLAREAHALGLEVLLEVHTESELAYVTAEVDMLGVNNRNLGSFHTDTDNSLRLAPLLPTDKLTVSESGMHTADDIRRLRRAGYQGFLIGGHLMSQPSPGEALKELITQLEENDR